MLASIRKSEQDLLAVIRYVVHDTRQILVPDAEYAKSLMDLDRPVMQLRSPLIAQLLPGLSQSSAIDSQDFIRVIRMIDGDEMNRAVRAGRDLGPSSNQSFAKAISLDSRDDDSQNTGLLQRFFV